MVITNKDKYNKRYGFPPDTSHSLSAVSKMTGFKLSGLKKIFDKGLGAFFNNPASVRPTVKSSQQWAMARVYSAVTGGPASKIDKDLLIRH